jgi:hypothetical protein
MPNLPISSLPELTALTQNAEFAVAEGGTTYRVKTSNLSPFPQVYGLFAQTGDTPYISGLTEQSIIDGGVGTLSVGANQFQIGDSFTATFNGHYSSANDSLNIRVKSDSVVLAESGIKSLNTGGVDVIVTIRIDFTIRSIGAAGVASIFTRGNMYLTKTSNASVEGFSFEDINNTTFDTTTSNTLDITVQFNDSDPSTYIYTDFFVLNKVY